VRARKKQGGVTVNAIAGTRVVFLGLDLTEAKRTGCLGFAIQRTDKTKGDAVWMRGKKTFLATDPGVGPRSPGVSTFDHPVQNLWWADYDVEPGRRYSYKVVPRYGTPDKLTGTAGPTVDVQTEAARRGKHSIFFNRGAVASQEYARDFDDQLPKDLTGDVQKAAYTYLSHGLDEALTDFIGRADGPDWSLNAAVYDFNWVPVLKALGAAAATGAKVAIVYDAIAGKSGPRKKSLAAIAEAGIGDLCTPRTKGKIMHNKFFVLSKGGTPVAVWTGSTNISENGIFGHLNVGHAVEDKTVAGRYLDYWKQLATDPDPPDQQDFIDAFDPTPAADVPWTAPITTVFSPHNGDAVLNRYAAIAASAQQALCMTFAFGMNKVFKDVYKRSDSVLRMALLEDYGSGAGKADQEREIRSKIQPRPNVVVSVGGSIPTNGFDSWLAEAKGLTFNVQWVHTKFMVVDPLSDSPTVVTGSANFSPDSTHTNDENMLVIVGDKRVADIYFTEYMRLFAHYGFREAVAIAIQHHEEWHPGHLETDWQKWLPPFFTAGDDRDIRRRYFSTGVAT
jgi:phosphatidylserine/phosphatidylglycerophosphate/cardiolipin synthase-like enzyme